MEGEIDRKPRVTYITAGAGGMYCGSCLRDNALVAELEQLGWDILLLPLYTPIRTDDVDRSVDQVFFGGINVYLQQNIPLFRHLPGLLDRWLDNPRLIRRVTAKSMSVDASKLGAMTLSMVRGEDGYQRREVGKLLRWLGQTARPELVCLTNLLVGGSIPAIKRELGVPVLVTLQGDDVFLDELNEPWRGRVLSAMRELAQQVDGFLTFSRFYRDRMADLLEVPPGKIHLVPLGIDSRGFDVVYRERQTRRRGKTIGYFARICPEKGFDLAVGAFLELAARDPEVRLLAGGWLSEKDRPFLAAQLARVEAAGLGERFSYLGAPDNEGKLAFFREIDIFCVPARFLEPKGLYVLEAMACGIPVVAPDAGAFPDYLAESGGGRLCRPGDEADLVKQLTEVEPECGSRGRAWVQERGTRRAMAEVTGEIFLSFCQPAEADGGGSPGHAPGGGS